MHLEVSEGGWRGVATVLLELYDLNDILIFTVPLGIPWHPISQNRQDFAFTFNYVGFSWDLAVHTVAIPDEKWLPVIEKIITFVHNASNKVQRHKVGSVQGTIQHLTFVCCTGRLFLPPLSTFLANFPNDYVSHHVPRRVLTSLSW